MAHQRMFRKPRNRGRTMERMGSVTALVQPQSLDGHTPSWDSPSQPPAHQRRSPTEAALKRRDPKQV